MKRSRQRFDLRPSAQKKGDGDATNMILLDEIMREQAMNSDESKFQTKSVPNNVVVFDYI
jgi:hypothetical protein